MLDTDFDAVRRASIEALIEGNEEAARTMTRRAFAPLETDAARELRLTWQQSLEQRVNAALANPL